MDPADYLGAQLDCVEASMAAVLTLVEGDPDPTRWLVWPTEGPTINLLLRCPPRQRVISQEAPFT